MSRRDKFRVRSQSGVGVLTIAYTVCNRYWLHILPPSFAHSRQSWLHLDTDLAYMSQLSFFTRFFFFLFLFIFLRYLVFFSFIYLFIISLHINYSVRYFVEWAHSVLHASFIQCPIASIDDWQDEYVDV